MLSACGPVCAALLACVQESLRRAVSRTAWEVAYLHRLAHRHSRPCRTPSCSRGASMAACVPRRLYGLLRGAVNHQTAANLLTVPASRAPKYGVGIAGSSAFIFLFIISPARATC